MQKLRLEVETVLGESADPMERIRLFIHAHLRALLQEQIRHVTILTELPELSRSHHQEVLTLRKDYADLTQSVIANGQEAGAIRTDIPARYLYLALLNILNWVVLWFRRNEALAVDELADLYCRIFLHGALAERRQRQAYLLDFETNDKKSAKTRRPDANEQGTLARLVEASAVLFSRRGYAATSTREIAAALGIQKASLYYHVGSKEELLFAICKSSLEQIRSDVEEALAAVHDPSDRVSALIGAHMESMLSEQEKHAAALSEMHLLSPERFGEVRLLRDAYEGQVRSVLQEGQEAGAVRADIEIKYLCLALLGLMNRACVWYRRGGTLSPGQLGQLFSSIFLSGAAR
jgi:AcrR family transcriptional regulator